MIVVRRYSDTEIQQKYLTDLRARLDADRVEAIENGEEPDKPTFMEDVFTATRHEWFYANMIRFFYPANFGLSRHELEFFESSDTVWTAAQVDVVDGQRIIDVILVDTYEGPV